MKAIFTKEAIDKFNLPKQGVVLSLEIEKGFNNNHYAIKVSTETKDDVEIDYYDIDYIKNGKKILDYFLNN